MKEIKYIIKDEMGIHARPAGELVKVAVQFSEWQITIKKDAKTADAKRIMGIMGLGVKAGQEIVVTAEGAKEEEAIVAIEKFLQENL